MVAHYACHASRIIFFCQKTIDVWLFSVTMSFISLRPSLPHFQVSIPPLLIVWGDDGRINACCVICTGCGWLSSASAAATCTKAWRPFFYFSDGEDEAPRMPAISQTHSSMICAAASIALSVCPCSTNR